MQDELFKKPTNFKKHNKNTQIKTLQRPQHMDVLQTFYKSRAALKGSG